MKIRMSRLKVLGWSFKQICLAAPTEAFVLTLFVILQGLLPAASLFAIQGIIHWIGNSSSFPILFISLWGGMLLGDIVLSPLAAIVRLSLNEKLLGHCNVLLMEKANAIAGLESFEDSKIYDEIQFLRKESSQRPLNFVYILSGFSKELIALLSVLTVLGTFAWWIPVAMLLACLPHAFSALKFEKQSWDQMLFRSPEARKLAWIASQTLDAKTAKELRLFDFGDFLVRRYKDLVVKMHHLLSRARWNQSLFSIGLSSLTVLGNVGIISVILLQAKSNTLQISSLVVAIQALVMTQSQLTGCVSYLGMTAPVFQYFNKLRIFLTSESTIPSCTPIALPPFREIRFKNVSFRYTNGHTALSDINLTIRRGEKIAFVGENGAGKSTLVKLLLRFYDPTEGEILVDGRDLSTIDATMWRKNISGIFQDFGQYHFTVGENIVLGDITASEERISHAAKRGGLTPVLKKLSSGFNTLLGKEFGGTTLSGGEWQKLAMSRAFLKRSDLLVLDEPTAALDARSEKDVFDKFADATMGKTVLLITHRLGSVAMADRVIVFKNGHLIEEGSQQQLLTKDGEYAKLFNMQAQQYACMPSSSLD